MQFAGGAGVRLDRWERSCPGTSDCQRGDRGKAGASLTPKCVFCVGSASRAKFAGSFGFC